MVAATIIEKAEGIEQLADALPLFLQIKTDGVFELDAAQIRLRIIAPESLAGTYGLTCKSSKST